jgi:hypothetical protein
MAMMIKNGPLFSEDALHNLFGSSNEDTVLIKLIGVH